MCGSKGRQRHFGPHVQAGSRGMHADVRHPEVRGRPHAVVCYTPTLLQGAEAWQQQGRGGGGASGGRQLRHHTSWRIAIAGGGAATASAPCLRKQNTQHALQARSRAPGAGQAGVGLGLFVVPGGDRLPAALAPRRSGPLADGPQPPPGTPAGRPGSARERQSRDSSADHTPPVRRQPVARAPRRPPHLWRRSIQKAGEHGPVLRHSCGAARARSVTAVFDCFTVGCATQHPRHALTRSGGAGAQRGLHVASPRAAWPPAPQTRAHCPAARQGRFRGDSAGQIRMTAGWGLAAPGYRTSRPAPRRGTDFRARSHAA